MAHWGLEALGKVQGWGSGHGWGLLRCLHLGVPGQPWFYVGLGCEVTPLWPPGGVKTYRAELGPARSLGMPGPFAEVSILTPPTLN